MENKEQEKARHILEGLKREGYDDRTATVSLALSLANITSADKSKRETAKRRVRELAAKGKTGI